MVLWHVLELSGSRKGLELTVLLALGWCGPLDTQITFFLLCLELNHLPAKVRGHQAKLCHICFLLAVKLPGFPQWSGPWPGWGPAEAPHF